MGKLSSYIGTQLVVPASYELDSLFDDGSRLTMVSSWKQKSKENKRWKDGVLKKANQGDGAAMALMADCYYSGAKGFSQDTKKAFAWFEKADAAGNVWGTVNMGYMLVLGEGIPTNEKEGMLHIGIAAGRGNDNAAALLGHCYADGIHGLPRDLKKAVRWLGNALDGTCPHKSMTAEDAASTQQMLYELLCQLQ